MELHLIQTSTQAATKCVSLVKVRPESWMTIPKFIPRSLMFVFWLWELMVEAEISLELCYNGGLICHSCDGFNLLQGQLCKGPIFPTGTSIKFHPLSSWKSSRRPEMAHQWGQLNQFPQALIGEVHPFLSLTYPFCIPSLRTPTETGASSGKGLMHIFFSLWVTAHVSLSIVSTCWEFQHSSCSKFHHIWLQ